MSNRWLSNLPPDIHSLQRKVQSSYYAELAQDMREAKLWSEYHTLERLGDDVGSAILDSISEYESAKRLSRDDTSRNREADISDAQLSPRLSAAVKGSPNALSRQDYQHLHRDDNFGLKEMQDWTRRDSVSADTLAIASEALAEHKAEQEAEQEAISSDVARRCQRANRKSSNGKRSRRKSKASTGNPQARLASALGLKTQ